MATESWEKARGMYDSQKEILIRRHAGEYMLIHTETLTVAFGDIANDPQNGGQMDAFKEYERMYGKIYGEFFGIRIQVATA